MTKSDHVCCVRWYRELGRLDLEVICCSLSGRLGQNDDILLSVNPLRSFYADLASSKKFRLPDARNHDTFLHRCWTARGPRAYLFFCTGTGPYSVRHIRFGALGRGLSVSDVLRICLRPPYES